jgi:hypothetical protein
MDILTGPAALRDVRRPDHPVDGALGTGDPPRVWVDADEVRGSELWRADPGGHLLAPLEIERSREGHRVALAHCTARLSARTAGATPGAMVTIAVSILRAAGEATELGAVKGSWWVTDEERPVLVLLGDRPWRTSAAELLDELIAQASGDMAAALTAVRDAVDPADARMAGATRFSARAQSAEDRLFELAEAEALCAADASTAPRRAAVGPPDEEDPAAFLPTLRATAQRLLDPSLVERLRRMIPSPGQREPRSSGRRVRPALVGALAAAAVVAGGLLWPASDAGSHADVVDADMTAPARASPAATDPAADASSVAAEGDGAAGATGPAVAASAAPSAADDPVDAAGAVLDLLAGCASPCADAQEDPTRTFPPGVATSAATRTLTLLDEYGGVAAVRVDAPEQPSQIVVIVRMDEKWLVRDIYDVADQP